MADIRCNGCPLFKIKVHSKAQRNQKKITHLKQVL